MERLRFLLVFSFMFILSACSMNNSSDSLDKSEVWEQSLEAMESLESYTMNSNYMTTVDELEISINAEGDVTHEPDAVHGTVQVGMPGLNLDVESYILDDKHYTYLLGRWLDFHAMDLQFDNFNLKNESYFENLSELMDEFEMEETDDEYILTLSGEGDKYNKLMEDLIESSSSIQDQSVDMQTTDIEEVKEIEVIIHVDKEDFLHKEELIVTELEGADITNARIETSISNANQLEPIEVPSDVEENVVDTYQLQEEFIEDIPHDISFNIPKITSIPEGYFITDYNYDDSYEELYLHYQNVKGSEIGLIVSPMGEGVTFGDLMLEEEEELKVQGYQGAIDDGYDYININWEQDGLLIQVVGVKPYFTKEQVLEMAESVKLD
ncbi:DUF6612 family protein [Gracilibacillus sp. YIM 98692]|uniref:DUF6612 family protein n=1 Tax=Gracilibacillus sp. YIM 98692 TaxID=2663532 RepID=UPI0013D55624|nr:DUF6612 family protein [Gracilibacillus sp. YIM 98692]